jgi:hypothetical protein
MRLTVPRRARSAVREAKGGDLESVVFLYFGPLAEALGVPPCEGSDNDRVCDLLDHFPYRVVEGIETIDFGPAMDSAADLVFAAFEIFIRQ